VTDLAAPVSTIAPSMNETLAEYMFLCFCCVRGALCNYAGHAFTLFLFVLLNPFCSLYIFSMCMIIDNFNIKCRYRLLA
jgi:hypothetical protein